MIYQNKILFIFIVLFNPFLVQSAKDDFNQHNPQFIKQAELPTKMWIRQLVSHAVSNFVPRSRDGDGLCTNHGQYYTEGVKNLTLWAVQMADAAASGPHGLVTGNTYQLGSFDQCVSINVPELNIKGKYVMVRIHFMPMPSDYPKFYTTDQNVFKIPISNTSVWEVFKPTLDERFAPLNVVQIGTCVPHSCTEEDVKISFEKSLLSMPQKELQFEVSINKEYTYSRAEFDENGYPSIFYIFWVVTALLVLMAIISTIHELQNGNDSPEFKDSWHSCFSLATNWRKLYNPSPGQFPTLSGLKVVSMFLIIYGHRMMCTCFGPLSNSIETRFLASSFEMTILTNGAIVVNTFIVITGFLTYHKTLKDIDKKVPFNFFKSVWRRWIRLTPCYVYVAAFTVCIYPFLELGPMGRGVLWVNHCNEYWWTHILYINNYVHPDKQCLIPSWYMAVDMQLYIYCSILGYALYKHRKTGFLIFGISAFILFLAPGINVILYGFKAITIFPPKPFDEVYLWRQFNVMYTHFESRAISYIVGMGAAYVYYKYKPKKISSFKESKLAMASLLIFFVQLCIIYYPWLLYSPGRPYSMIENVIFAVFYKIVWGGAICWYILSHSLLNFSTLGKILGTRHFQILNNLNYAALLVHTPLQILLVGMQRNPRHFSYTYLLWDAIGDIVFTYTVALFVHLIVEAPLSGLQDCNCFGFNLLPGNAVQIKDVKDDNQLQLTKSNSNQCENIDKK